MGVGGGVGGWEGVNGGWGNSDLMKKRPPLACLFGPKFRIHEKKGLSSLVFLIQNSDLFFFIFFFFSFIFSVFFYIFCFFFFVFLFSPIFIFLLFFFYFSFKIFKLNRIFFQFEKMTSRFFEIQIILSHQDFIWKIFQQNQRTFLDHSFIHSSFIIIIILTR